MTAMRSEIERLWRQRPRSTFLRSSAIVLIVLVVYAWTVGGFFSADILSSRRMANLERFLTELRPFPLQGRDFDVSIAVQWASAEMTAHGIRAACVTLAIAIVAIVLAGGAGSLLSLAAARTLVSPEPYLPAPKSADLGTRIGFRLLTTATRTLLIFLRSIPEYLWAFLLIALLGPVSWAAILALAIHNTGILGKLDAEVVENLEPGPMRALRGSGAGRLQIVAAAILPLVTPRWLLFFFYRWETCVREATVIGLLGIESLGALIQDSRARQQYDLMLLLILVGAAIVVVGDLSSGLARAFIRRGRWP